MPSDEFFYPRWGGSNVPVAGVCFAPSRTLPVPSLARGFLTVLGTTIGASWIAASAFDALVFNFVAIIILIGALSGS
jgi:hypothetical protein